MNETGKLYVVGTPIGNMGDLTPRAAETLRNADYIAAEDTRVTLKLLTANDIKKPLLSYYRPKEEEKSGRILELLRSGAKVALVSDAGMPCISDPGVFLVRKCRDEGIPVESVPGCCAAVTAAAISGEDCARFVFEGFLPAGKTERENRLSEVKSLRHTLIFYEAPHKLRGTLSDLERLLGSGRKAAICRELTKIHEEVIRGSLSELTALYNDKEPRGEYVIIVEGAKESENKTKFTLEQAAQKAKELTESGEKPAEACRLAAKITGISKREIYRLITKGEENDHVDD